MDEQSMLMDLWNRMEKLEAAFAGLCRTDTLYHSGKGPEIRTLIDGVSEWLADYEKRTGASGSDEPPTRNAE